MSLFILSNSACISCDELVEDILDRDAGVIPEKPVDAGEVGDDDEETPFVCTEDLDGIGDPCTNSPDSPLCGVFVCCEQGIPGCDGSNLFTCLDPGANACGACGDLDESDGRLGTACGEYGCGTWECADDGLGVICLGDQPTNACGGCTDLSETLEEADIGDICSGCETGLWTCGEDGEAAFCVGGREDSTRCGGCEPCVLAEAFMDDRFDGGYILSGTRVVIEDVGNNQIFLRFQPLIEGPGADALAQSELILSNGLIGLEETRLSLFPFFSATTNQVPADPARPYEIDPSVQLEDFNVVKIIDHRLGVTISEGTLIHSE